MIKDLYKNTYYLVLILLLFSTAELTRVLLRPFVGRRGVDCTVTGNPMGYNATVIAKEADGFVYADEIDKEFIAKFASLNPTARGHDAKIQARCLVGYFLSSRWLESVSLLEEPHNNGDTDLWMDTNVAKKQSYGFMIVTVVSIFLTACYTVIETYNKIETLLV